LARILPIAYGLQDILSFVDVQDYNTPPLEGLDGEIYQAGTVDYHAAVTELVLRGFSVGADPAQVFPGLPQNRVAVGFLTGETTPDLVEQAMRHPGIARLPQPTRNPLLSCSRRGRRVQTKCRTRK
jgi:chitinase